MLRALLRLVSVAAAATAATSVLDEPRPTLDEWKDGKAAEAAEADAKGAKQKKMAAVEKAVELLESLQQQVLKEGEEEAKTYEKFGCFCKDTTKERIEEITKGEDSKIELTSYIGELGGKRDGHDTLIQEMQDEIVEHQKDQKAADSERSATKELYDSNTADLMGALEALQGAIKSLKASKTPSLLQIRSVSDTIRTAALLADALGVASAGAAKTAVAMLQDAPVNEVQMQDYDFHSDGIISTLEKLLDDFRSEKVSVDEEEVESIRVYQNFTEVKTHAIKTANGVIDKTKKAREDTIAEIETSNQELSTVEATLLEDKEYSNKLSQMCTDKAKTWDQRSKLRAAEISTLTQAIGIIKGAISEKTSAATMRLAQQGASLRIARAVASDPSAMEAIEADAETADDSSAPALIQYDVQRESVLATARRHLRGVSFPHDGSEADGKHVIVSLLRSRGAQLHSTLLASLASKIAADPFAKVKTLIQELIERLLQEAANEASHKGWCDKAMSDAKQRRDYAAEEIEGLNSEMARLEARRDSLNEALVELAKDIAELKDSRKIAKEERAAESKENKATVDEAQSGLDALNMCIELLDRFYKTAKKETVDLSLSQGPEDDAPLAGFDNGEAYLGAQSESGGILGMLDVMKSDFIRTIEETQLAEERAQREHLEFLTETGKSLVQKEEAERQRKAQLTDTQDKFDEAETSLVSESGKLTTALGELLELKPVCIDTGMTYEDRVAMREEEVEALKKADCILGKFAEYGPAGAADAC